MISNRAEDVDSLEQSLKHAGRPVTFYHYPGTGHWFAEPDRKDAYNQAAANSRGIAPLPSSGRGDLAYG